MPKPHGNPPVTTTTGKNPGAASVNRQPSGGRPRKFGEPSRPVTVTLPESTLQALAEVDPDRATAIVRLAGGAGNTPKASTRLARIVDIGKGRSVIIVASSRCLKKIPFLHLIETSPGEFLLALQSGHDFKNLELAVRDELDELPASEERERALLSALLKCFACTRKKNIGIRAEILLLGKSRRNTI